MELTAVIKNAVIANHYLKKGVTRDGYDIICGEFEEHSLFAMLVWYELLIMYGLRKDALLLMGISGGERDELRDIRANLTDQKRDRFNTKLALCVNYINHKTNLICN